MNTTSRWSLIIIVAVILGAALLLSGVALGRTGSGLADTGQANTGDDPYDYEMMGSSMMDSDYGRGDGDVMPYGSGMVGPGMMEGKYGRSYTDTLPYGYGMMGPSTMGMMGMMDTMRSGFGAGMMGMMESGKAGALYGIKPLSLADAQATVEGYLAGLNTGELTLGEVMIFENHAYAQVVEESTGIGAFEVLVDPVTRAVWPEPGPNMMWNLKYSPMSGLGGIGMMGMMGGFDPDEMMGGATAPDVSAPMPVGPAEAVEAAQRYLDAYLPGAQAEDKADVFYGYYTLHILRDGETVGMLSVNGYSRQVFLHTWHGDVVR